MGEAKTTLAPRLVSLDAYRGFIMLAMASAGFELHKVAVTQFPDSPAWQWIGNQFEHVAWTGCSFWDLIQPSFMFMVGVAIPYSHASRLARGDSRLRIAGHVLLRSFILVLLGVFLSSNWSQQTNFSFVNVLTQIGLGYSFVYLLHGRGLVVQSLAAVGILAGYWYLFFQHPSTTELQVGSTAMPDFQGWQDGLFAHWNKHTNFAGWVDRQILAVFPYSDSYPFNAGGYQVLNFVPSMATMIFGLMAGELLRGPATPAQKWQRLFVAGALCLAVGLAAGYTVCPLVKRIWTPSWAVFSSGWTFWMLAAFYGLIDLKGYRRWAFPLVVVGMNSIAIYCMAQLLKPWVRQTLKTHLNHWWQIGQSHLQPDSLRDTVQTGFGPELFQGTYGPIVQSAAVLFVFWLVCLWMYRQKIFIRI